MVIFLPKQERQDEVNMFGQLLKKYRTYNDMSQDELSSHFGYSNNTYIGLLENGKRKPPKCEIVKNLVTTLIIPETEQYDFYKAAFEERFNDDDKAYIDKLNKLKPQVLEGSVKDAIRDMLGTDDNDEVLDALSDVEILKFAIKLKKMDPEKRATIIRLGDV